jgi:uncharacterized protein YndB with AHSA1/START domain
MNETTLTQNGNILTLERVINAPKDKVWAAYTDPEIFTKWWGPDGWSTTVKEFDVKPGGTALYGMKCEDPNQGEWFGKESWGKFVFEDVSPKDSFVYTDYFTDDNGKATEGMPSTKSTITFVETDGKTKITTVSTYESEADLRQVLEMGMEEGIKQTLDRLEKLVATA